MNDLYTIEYYICGYLELLFINSPNIDQGQRDLVFTFMFSYFSRAEL